MAERAYSAALNLPARRTARVRDKITRQYWAFATAHCVRDTSGVASLLAFTQYLIDQGLSFRTIRNYISALKANLTKLNQPVVNFEHSTFKAFMKSLIYRKPIRMIPKDILTIAQIHVFFKINASLPHYFPYALAFSLGLFAYLHISNLVPSSELTFDTNKQLPLADIKCEHDGLAVHLKWAKNLQRLDQFHIVRVPRIDQHPFLCAHYNYLQRVRSQGNYPGAPLIMSGGVPLTERAIRLRMKQVLA